MSGAVLIALVTNFLACKTACLKSAPFAIHAVMADERTHPVPCVACVRTYGAAKIVKVSLKKRKSSALSSVSFSSTLTTSSSGSLDRGIWPPFI